MIKTIPRIFREDLHLLAKVESGSNKVLLIVSTLCPTTPMVYFVLIHNETRVVLDVQQSQVMWQNLNLQEPKCYKVYSSVMAGMYENYAKSARTSGKAPLVLHYMQTKTIQPRHERLDILQELLRLSYVRDILGDLTTGSRNYNVTNASHPSRNIANYHAELAMTFGRLLPIDRVFREDPENDEAVGRALELFLQDCKKLNFLIDNQHPFEEPYSDKHVAYVFAKCKRFKHLMNYLMNPFISIKL